MSPHSVLQFYQLKYVKNIPKSIRLTDTKSMHNHCQILQREIMPKVRKARVIILLRDMSHPMLHCTFLPNTIKIFQRVFKLQSGHKINFKNKTKGDNSESKKARDVILVCDTLSHPVLHFYLPSIIKIFKRVFNLQTVRSITCRQSGA